MKSAQKKPAVRPHKSRRHAVKQAVKRARPVHHRVLLHPMTVFLLLCVGVFIVNSTFRANADSYIVTAKVAATPLTDGATITEPLDSSIFSNASTTVKGSCPTNSYVVLYRNGAMSGVAWCAPNNTYEIQTSLYPNSNTLKVQDFNITDDPGPITPEITVTYIPPVTPSTLPTTPSTTTPASGTGSQPVASTGQADNLPLITSDFTYKTFTSKTSFEWEVEIAGGKAPYQLTTNWGDGTSSTQKVPAAQTVRVKHRYSKTGQFAVVFKIVDDKGSVSLLQIVAIIRSSEESIIGANKANTPGSPTFISAAAGAVSRHWLAFAWGSYATVSLMGISFWLGEQQKINALINAKRVARPRTHKRHIA